METSQKSIKGNVVEAARGIFTRFGFKKTTMDEIAQSCHMGKSTLYYYFKSKEEIFKAVVEKESKALKRGIERAVDQQKTPQKKLHAYVITRMHALNRLSNFHSVLKDKYLKRYTFIEKIRKRHLKDELETMKGILKEGIERENFIINNLDLTSSTFIIALRGLEYPWAIENGMLNAGEKVDNLLGILFNGIVKK